MLTETGLKRPSTPLDFVKLAAIAETSPRTIAHYVAADRPQRRTTVRAIKDALKQLGYADPHAE